jgi:transcription initiation factor TFIID subunit 6
LIDKDVSEFLLADLELKITEILQESKKVMRHSKRHVLTTQDVDQAFKKLSIPETYGYPSSTPFNFTKIQNEQQNIWFHKPAVLNIRELVQKPLFDQSSIKLSYSKYLTAVDGTQPEIAENVREINQEDPV